jgi:addiction module HigA family antidote
MRTMWRSSIIIKGDVMRDIDPVPPGEVLLEDFLKPMGITQYRLAKSIKVPASRIHDVVHGKRPINAELALRLARFLGTDAQSWVNLQAHYDLERAKIALAARVKKEVKPHARGS